MSKKEVKTSSVVRSVRVDAKTDEKISTIKSQLGFSCTSDVITFAINRYYDNLTANTANKTNINILPYTGKKKSNILSHVLNVFSKSKCKKIVDVFCGSCSLLSYFTYYKENGDNEEIKRSLDNVEFIINDCNSDLINLYQVINNNLNDFVTKLYEIPLSQNRFEEYNEKLKEKNFSNNIEHAVAKYYVMCTAFRNPNQPTTFNHNANWNRYKKAENIQFLSYILNLPNVKISNISYEELLKKYNSNDTFFYLDPPYFNTEHYYDFKNRIIIAKNEKEIKESLINDKYKQLDFNNHSQSKLIFEYTSSHRFTNDDHKKLKNIITSKDFKSTFVISYKACVSSIIKHTENRQKECTGIRQ